MGFRLIKLVFVTLFWLCLAGAILGLMIAVIAVFIALTRLPMFAVLFPLLLIAAIMLVLLAANLARWNRRRRGLVVLGYIEQAVRLNLPLHVMMLAAVRNERGMTRRRLKSFTQALLDGGPTVGEALAASTPELPAAIPAQLTAAQRVGRLAPQLRRLLAAAQRHATQASSQTILFWAYPAVMFLVVVGAASFLSYFIFPSYGKIMADVDSAPPWITQTVASTVDHVSAPLVWLTCFVLIAMVARALWQIARGGNRATDPLVNAWDVLAWHLPLTGRLRRDQAMARLCHLLAEAAAAGVPLAAAAAEAGHQRIFGPLARRFRHWAGVMKAGHTPETAARDARLPDLVVGLLATGGATHCLPQTLRFLADYYDARYERNLALAQAAIIPAMTIVLGILTSLIALAVMLPLVRMIEINLPTGDIL